MLKGFSVSALCCWFCQTQSTCETGRVGMGRDQQSMPLDTYFFYIRGIRLRIVNSRQTALISCQ